MNCELYTRDQILWFLRDQDSRTDYSRYTKDELCGIFMSSKRLALLNLKSTLAEHCHAKQGKGDPEYLQFLGKILSRDYPISTKLSKNARCDHFDKQCSCGYLLAQIEVQLIELKKYQSWWSWAKDLVSSTGSWILSFFSKNSKTIINLAVLVGIIYTANHLVPMYLKSLEDREKAQLQAKKESAERKLKASKERVEMAWTTTLGIGILNAAMAGGVAIASVAGLPATASVAGLVGLFGMCNALANRQAVQGAAVVLDKANDLVGEAGTSALKLGIGIAALIGGLGWGLYKIVTASKKFNVLGVVQVEGHAPRSTKKQASAKPPEPMNTLKAPSPKKLSVRPAINKKKKKPPAINNKKKKAPAKRQRKPPRVKF
jgi:hypothetical protein